MNFRMTKLNPKIQFLYQEMSIPNVAQPRIKPRIVNHQQPLKLERTAESSNPVAEPHGSLSFDVPPVQSIKTLKLRIVNPPQLWDQLAEFPPPKDRIVGSWHLYQGYPIQWDGKYKKCQHNKQVHRCRECGGWSICEHDKRRENCRQCGGASICKHSKQRSTCRECRGSSICEHDKQRHLCRKCGGASICEHDKQRHNCKQCRGASICEHNKCRQCGGASICEHDIRRHSCKQCKGSLICEHNKHEKSCRECFTHPQNFCQICTNIYVNKKSRTYPLCLRCHCLTHPNEKIPTRFKMKEHHILDHLCSYCPDYEIIHDQVIEGGCSKRRPDLFLECGTHSLVVEIDEDQHSDYKCENKRMMQIFIDLGSRPLVVLRFNPDKYTNAEGQNMGGLFSFGSDNLIVVEDPRQLDQRVYTLSQRIRYYVENVSLKELTMERLYYDELRS
jgi:hypothetical protein